MSNRKKVVVISICLFLICSLSTLFYIINDRNREWHWDIYYGKLKTEHAIYGVEIDEADYGQSLRRIVHLRPVGEPSYVSITGHDNNSDGQWEEIFYCGNHELIKGQDSDKEYAFGCNSVVRMPTGYWKFEPCPSDEGDIRCFSDEAIYFAITELDAAMEQIYNKKHIAQHWKWDSEQQKVAKVFDRFIGPYSF